MYFFIHFNKRSQYFQGCAKILEIPEGRGWGKFWGLILEKPLGEGGHMANPVYGYFLEPHISVHSLVLISVATAKHRNNGNFPVEERLNFSLKFCSCC